MKNFLVLFLLFFFLYLFGENKVYPNYIEVNLEEKIVKIADLNLSGYKISGDISYKVDKKNKETLFFLYGKNLKAGDKRIESCEVQIIKRGDILFIDKIKSPNFTGAGTIDLNKEKILFNFSGNWQEKTEHLKGDINLKTKVWGNFESFLVSGSFVIFEGVYEGIPFKKLRCSFLGTPPVFNVTDAEVLLYKGSVFELKGDLDIRDSNNFFPGVQFVSQKLFVDGWQIFGVQNEVGLKKQIDDKFNIEIDTEQQQETGTELRYSLENDNFLKLRMEEKETILGVERKTEF
ncbi:MAG: hypothetical protein K9L69_00685 [Candidatus Omnitrophica bacterium]|nr:hypothetical protein [Candidatus Omnitrophota bacterium]MCF7894641.1 hypothetical protein [Candidatus Omnitrophota bacterium]